MNESKVRPIDYRVIVRPDEVEERTKGGIILPPGTREADRLRQEKGTLVAKGDSAFDEGWSDYEREQLVPDARVLVCAYAGTSFKVENVMYRLCNDKDITALLEE